VLLHPALAHSLATKDWPAVELNCHQLGNLNSWAAAEVALHVYMLWLEEVLALFTWLLKGNMATLLLFCE
jgi:hypothetical protein